MSNHACVEEGVSESALFDFFNQAKRHAMSLLILDEIDMIAGKWTSKKSDLDMRLSSMLMSCIDNVSNAYVIGMTSRLHAIEPAFLRSGRLDDLQEIIINTPEQRYAILSIITQSKDTSMFAASCALNVHI